MSVVGTPVVITPEEASAIAAQCMDRQHELHEAARALVYGHWCWKQRPGTSTAALFVAVAIKWRAAALLATRARWTWRTT